MKSRMLLLTMLLTSVIAQANISEPKPKTPIIPIEEVYPEPQQYHQRDNDAPPTGVSPLGTPYQGNGAALQQRLNQIENGIPIQVQEEYREVFAEEVPPEPDFIQEVKSKFKPKQDYDLEPKSNLVIPVGIGMMNSIITNYQSLSVKTSDEDAVLEIDGGILYATIKINAPVGLILLEDGVNESQIAVTLVPMQSPPAVIDLNIKLTDEMIAKANKFQQQIKEEQLLDEAQSTDVDLKNQSYVSRLLNLLKPIPQGKLPRGFTFSTNVPEEFAHPCNMAVHHQALQRITGGREVIDIVLVTNNSNAIYPVREEMCLADDTLAVALFEKSYLQPGQQTEIYIVRDKYYRQAIEREFRRPSLISGAQ